MSCHNCGEQNNCGCTQESLHISQVCNPIDCPIDECGESFSASCIRYTGDPLICGNVTVVPTDTNVAQALSNIMAFICINDSTTEEILCGNDVVVQQGVELEEALGLVVAYFCNAVIMTEDLACTEAPLVVFAGATVQEALQSVFNYFCEQVAGLQEQIDNIVIPVLIGGTNVNLVTVLDELGNVVSYTINVVIPAVVIPTITLANAGATESLVNDGVGPALATKSLTAGIGIGITSNATEITITNTNTKKKFVKEVIFPDGGSLNTFILIDEYLPCLVASDYCGVATPSITDIIVTGYWFDSVNNFWKEFTNKDKSEIYVDPLGNVLVVAQLPAGLIYPINARIIITN